MNVERTEIKYAVSNEVASQVLRCSSVFLEADRGLTAPQRITSLYLDGPDLTFLRWHEQGRANRFKLRVRTYGDRMQDCVYAEIKSKKGSVVRKRRAEVPAAMLAILLSRGDLETGSSALSEFIRKRKAFRAEPKILISCLRESLRQSADAGEVAVTIDRHIVSQRTCRSDFGFNPDTWSGVMLPGGLGSEAAILELKYSNQPPAWMNTLILELAPHRVSFSKYRAAMQQHHRSSSVRDAFNCDFERRFEPEIHAGFGLDSGLFAF
jgi:hypothetical protein